MGAPVALAAFLGSTPVWAQEFDAGPVATVILDTLAPADYGDWAYDWGAVSSRIARHMHWHLPDPDPRDRAPGTPIERYGWVDTTGQQVGVDAQGDERRVRTLSFEIRGYDADAGALLAALQGAGATLETVSASPDEAHYRIARTGRDTGELVRQRSCTSPHSAAAQRCWTTFTLILPDRSAE